MCCDLAGSVRSREHWLWDTARKRNAPLLFSIVFWESFNCYNFGTTSPIQVTFSAKCTPPDEDFTHIENWKCHMFNFQLIPLDRITYVRWNSPMSQIVHLLTCVLVNQQYPAVATALHSCFMFQLQQYIKWWKFSQATSRTTVQNIGSLNSFWFPSLIAMIYTIFTKSQNVWKLSDNEDVICHILNRHGEREWIRQATQNWFVWVYIQIFLGINVYKQAHCIL